MMERRRLIVLVLVLAAGCGTTRSTDTTRTATEQLLVSDAVDRSLEQLNFKSLAGTTVYLDAQFMDKVPDKDYVMSAVREKLAADGALLREKREESDVVVEVRVGALGTNRYEWFIGIPEVALPTTPVPLPAFIPKIPVVERIRQEGTAKILVFAYDRETGQFLADSGSRLATTDNQSLWFLGLGPLEKGSVRDRVRLAGDPLPTLPELAPDLPLLSKRAGKEEGESAGAEAGADAPAPSGPAGPATSQPNTPVQIDSD